MVLTLDMGMVAWSRYRVMSVSAPQNFGFVCWPGFFVLEVLEV